jgi:hypothetical protein
MPHFALFLQGFHLVPGAQIGGFTLQQAYGHEETMKRYRSYEYPIVLEFQTNGGGTPDALLQAVRSIPPRVIHTSYGTPYECSLTQPHVVKTSGPTLQVHVLGQCKRAARSA